MGICGSTDVMSLKLKNFVIDYPQYNVEESNKTKGKKSLDSIAAKFYDHYKTFMKYEKELIKTNKDLHSSFFSKGKNTTDMEVKGLKSDDEVKFLFFFNLRIFISIQIKDSYINFPRFCMMHYPKFKPSESTLKKISITDSTVVFDETQEGYNRIKNLEFFDLSYNNIDNLPIMLKKLTSLKTLILRRNNIITLSPQLKSLSQLSELDLSENKLKKIPDICFELESLIKLNLNSNFIDSLETNVRTSKLEYLLLANNLFTNFPHDIINLEKLVHLALDNNKIPELNMNVINECKSSMKISLANNLLKNRDGLCPEFKNDIFTIKLDKGDKQEAISNSITENKPTNGKNDNHNEEEQDKNASGIETSKSTKRIKQVKMAKVEGSKQNHSKAGIVVKDQDQSSANSSYIDMIVTKQKNEVGREELMKRGLIEKSGYSNVANIQEIKLNNKIKEELMLMTFAQGTEEQIMQELLNLKKKSIVKEFLKELIAKRLDSEIIKFQDNDLKLDIKNLYYELSKEKIKLTWKLKDNVELGDESLKILKEKHYKINDLSNLVFLKSLHSSLTASKVKLLLQYLRNIDNNLCLFLRDLIDEHEVYSLTLILTELKLFLKEVIDYYKRNIVGYMEIVYEHKIFNNTNVIHRIFQEPATLKILYNLGLSEIRSEGCETVVFHINNIVHIKHQLIESYFGRLINEIKNLKTLVILD